MREIETVFTEIKKKHMKNKNKFGDLYSAYPALSGGSRR
jgi:hypothetical protein